MTADHETGSSGLLGVVLVLVGLAGALMWASILTGPIRLATGLLEARTHLEDAEASLSEGRTRAAKYDTLAAIAAADRARRGFRAGGPALDLADRLPVIGDALGEIDHLIAAAEHSAAAAGGSLHIAETALRGEDRLIVPDTDDPEGGSRIRIERLRELGRILADVRTEVAAAKDELEAVRLRNLPRRARAPVRTGIRTAVEAQTALADAEAGFALLPDILGADGPRNYLIGFQNTAEQRGTGGAILQFQALTIDDGRLRLSGKANSVYDVDKNRTPIDIPIPEDAWYVAGIEDAQRFGNANWSPDWPLSAQLSLAYGEATPSDKEFPDFDGMIAIDPIGIQKLMPGTGPYTTEGSRNRISSGRVVHFLLYKAYASYPIPGVRRVVLNQVVDGFVDRMLDPLRPTELVRGMGEALSRKHMQIWMRAPAEQGFIEQMEWDAGIARARRADYLMAIEQNVGGNKLDHFDENRIAAQIEISGDDAHHATELLVHNGVFLPQPRYSMGDTQSNRACATTRCPTHRPMLNLYVPQGAELLGTEVRGTRLDTPPPGIWTGDTPPTHIEKGKRVWSGTLQIPPGEDGSLVFEYLVPGVVRTEDGRRIYRLHVQHQPKVRPEILDLRLTLPPGAKDVRAPGWKRDGDVLVQERPLLRDMILEVSWQE